MTNPHTRAEWQEAVDLAEAGLAFVSARQFGLVTGGPTFNVDRCLELLERGRQLGIEPAPDTVAQYTAVLLAGDQS